MAEENGLGISFLGREGSGEAQILGEQPNAAQTYIQNVEQERVRRGRELAARKAPKNPEYDMKYDTPHEKLTPYLQSEVDKFQNDISEAIKTGRIQDPSVQAELNRRDYRLRNQHAIAGLLKKQDQENQQYALKNPDKIHYKTYEKGRSSFFNDFAPEELLSGDHPLPMHGGIVDRTSFAQDILGGRKSLEVGEPIKSTRRAPGGTDIIEEFKQNIVEGSSALEHKRDPFTGKITTVVPKKVLDTYRSNPILEASFAIDAEKSINQKVLSGQLPPEAANDPEVMEQEINQIASNDLLAHGENRNPSVKITSKDYADVTAKEQAKSKGEGNTPIVSTNSEGIDIPINDVNTHQKDQLDKDGNVINKKGSVARDEKGNPITTMLPWASLTHTIIEPKSKSGKRETLTVPKHRIRDIEKIDIPGSSTGTATFFPTSIDYQPVKENGSAHFINKEQAIKNKSKLGNYIHGYYIDEDKAKNDVAFKDELVKYKNGEIDLDEFSKTPDFSKYAVYVNVKSDKQDLDLLKKKGVDLSEHEKGMKKWDDSFKSSKGSQVSTAESFMKKHGK